MSVTSRLVFIFLALALCSCAGMGPAANRRLQNVVAKNVSVGMPFDTALKNLDKAGFSCDEHYGVKVGCVRKRHGFLYTCVHQVSITPSSSPQVVQAVQVPKIMCASL